MALEHASFPIVFLNDKNEVDVGNIFLHLFIEIKKFRMFRCFKIEISLRKNSTFLVRWKKNRSIPHIWPSKVPMEKSSDFTAISLERYCIVLATMKKSQQQERYQLR
ncbi:hypothetical protein KSP40_PGU020201 [Platanthera guangdongensis]|uniref:DUF7138 domain-containing protein n=1 Tax=Platanthera guangdongensis TaxID=2320717 RepID=A0ABR2M6Z4_9ASPA